MCSIAGWPYILARPTKALDRMAQAVRHRGRGDAGFDVLAYYDKVEQGYSFPAERSQFWNLAWRLLLPLDLWQPQHYPQPRTP